MLTLPDRKLVRRTIRKRIRSRLAGSADRPRLAIFRSQKHIYAQAIDDLRGHTIACASTRDPDLRGRATNGSTIEAAKLVGGAIAGKLKAAGVTAVVFDRGGFLYHGRVKALAEAARAEGLSF
jgi:large subunit ribosomal protein L18